MKYVWKKLPSRTGQTCVVVAKGKKNSCLVQFEDGFQMITSNYAVRKD
jgi:hypothetical protein